MMKGLLLVFLCALAGACSTTRKPEPRSVLRGVDAVLGREYDVRRFEGRLSELGAQIDPGAKPGERVATVALPGKPGYFPPRTLRVTYVIHDFGRIEVRSADVTALGPTFALK